MEAFLDACKAAFLRCMFSHLSILCLFDLGESVFAPARAGRSIPNFSMAAALKVCRINGVALPETPASSAGVDADVDGRHIAMLKLHHSPFPSASNVVQMSSQNCCAYANGERLPSCVTLATST